MSISHEGNGRDPSEPGELLADRYRIEALVGRGGMADVYRAFDESLGRQVAIKLFRPDLADADDVRRQRDEITLLAGMNHPGLVTLFDAVADDREEGVDRAFLVMEFVDGPDLRTRLLDGPLDPRSTALAGVDIADALSYIHERGVVHRDVKPGNILLPHGTAARSHAKLADFGIARIVDGTRLTATGSLIGTASYLSPEQAAGTALGPPSDIYSLGLVLLESLTGERAFPGSALESTVARLNRDPELPESLDNPWQELLRRMTARLPEDRPTAASVSQSLSAMASAHRNEPNETLVLPLAVGDSATGVLPNAEVRTAPTTRFGREPLARSPRPARTRYVAAAVVAAAILVPAAWFAVANPLSPVQGETPVVETPAGDTPSTPAPSTSANPAQYPTVEGDLGTHLEQLQRSVEP